MPLILNIWTTNTRLVKDEIKVIPIWVKLHKVPVVAYSEIGLSLVLSQIGRPLLLDAYTSNVCVNSWGQEHLC